jgi:hypothetical protein
MGAIAEAFVAFAQPLLDQTDGSEEELNKAFAISQLCYNLALLPDDERSAAVADMQRSLKMSDAEFDDFRRSVLDPMIQRHEAMFPRMHGRAFHDSSLGGPSLSAHPKTPVRGEKYPGTDRYAPCPCNSGEKYKFCCGSKGR